MPEVRLEITDLAIDQINSIFDYHENSHKGKGGDFLEVLWDCLDKLQTTPQSWQFLGSKEDKIRRAITQNPQTIILYSIEGTIIYIYEVYDSRQNWKSID